MKRIRYAVLALVFITVSCALESKFSLPKNETIDSNLLGTWYSKNDQNSEDWVRIDALDEFTYKLTFNDDSLTAFTTTINGHRIVNIVDNRNDTPNAFYGFSVKKNVLEILEVDENLVEEDFKSQKELIEFFNKNVDRPDFFVNPEQYKRKKSSNYF